MSGAAWLVFVVFVAIATGLASAGISLFIFALIAQIASAVSDWLAEQAGRASLNTPPDDSL